MTPAGADGAPLVRIHYHRPPDRRQLFEQRLVYGADDVFVTLMERTPLPRPMRVADRTVLEHGSPVVWFTFPGAWHDIGRFHTADGRFTGIYANILTPVRFLDAFAWETTDLFLDVWLDGASGAVEVLDEDELAAALEHGWIDERTAEGARREAERLAAAARAGTWPPGIVAEWTLARARRRLASQEDAG